MNHTGLRFHAAGSPASSKTADDMQMGADLSLPLQNWEKSA
jgi:hypothetical protein